MEHLGHHAWVAAAACGRMLSVVTILTRCEAAVNRLARNVWMTARMKINVATALIGSISMRDRRTVEERSGPESTG